MKKVVICGLGAVGLTYGSKLWGKSWVCDLRVLVDSSRLERYRKNKPTLNGVELDFEYILPTDKFEADLIIIATKWQGLDSAIDYIKNFVGENTVILSLLNGISSEEKIQNAYPQARVLKSYFIGHSAVREGNSVTQDGVGEIVIENDPEIIEFFKNCGINYSVPENIDYSMWVKFAFNLAANQVSAILDLTFGEMKRNKKFLEFIPKVVSEVKNIAELKGVKGVENLETDVFKSLDRMCDDGKTSMLQDIIASRPTEVDMFGGEIIRLGKEFGIDTPINQMLYDLIKIKEEK